MRKKLRNASIIAVVTLLSLLGTVVVVNAMDNKNPVGQKNDWNTISLNHDDSTSWFEIDKLVLPNDEDVKKIEIGMTLDEVVRLLGKPQRDNGYGRFLPEFDLMGNKTLHTYFEKQYENFDETSVYGQYDWVLMEYFVS